MYHQTKIKSIPLIQYTIRASIPALPPLSLSLSQPSSTRFPSYFSSVFFPVLKLLLRLLHSLVSIAILRYSSSDLVAIRSPGTYPYRHLIQRAADTMKFFATTLVAAAAAASVVSAQSSSSSSSITSTGSALSTCPTTGIYGGYTYVNGTLPASATVSMSSMSSSPAGSTGTTTASATSSASGSNSSVISSTASPTPSATGVRNGAGSLQVAGLSAVLLGMAGAAFL